jgi:polar amino acid transport system substrate-binding protein
MRFRRFTCIWAIILAVVLGMMLPVMAQSPTPPPVMPNPVRGVTRVIPPFVVRRDGKLAGFSMELWNQIAANLNMTFEIKTVDTVTTLLKTVENQAVDIGIAAISITSEREKILDFSQPIFNSGLQILVKAKTSRGGLDKVVSSIFSPTLLQLIGVMLFIVLIPAHLIWWFERKHERGFLQNTAYFPGIFKALWWAAATLATQAEEMPKAPWSRIFSVLWMFVSVVFVAYFTATVTTSLTVEQLQSNIKGPDDLPGKRIATITGSTSANYLRESNITAVTYPQINQAFQALEREQVDAVVYDAPILMYYAAHEGKGKAKVVGSIFEKESYGIALPTGSPLRKEINQALLSLQENDTYEEIYDRWFK